MTSAQFSNEQMDRIKAVREIRNLTCSGPCDHTTEEHNAFDLGIADGEAGCNENPFRSNSLRFAWRSGHAVSSVDIKQV